MRGYLVSLFGHREVEKISDFETRLENTLLRIISQYDFVTFLIGRNGDFDEYAASVIKRVQKSAGKEKCDIVLVMAYPVSDIEYYEDYYDDIIIPESVQGEHPKGAIIKRNKWMVDYSDEVIVFVKRSSGGAYNSYRYALKLQKKVTNMFDGFLNR